ASTLNTRTDFQILYGAYVRPLLEYANPVVYSGRTKDVILIERVQRAATKMVAGLKSMDYETRLVVLDLFPLEYRRLRMDLILTYALFEQGLADRFFTVHPANTRRGHVWIQIICLGSASSTLPSGRITGVFVRGKPNEKAILERLYGQTSTIKSSECARQTEIPVEQSRRLHPNEKLRETGGAMQKCTIGASCERLQYVCVHFRERKERKCVLCLADEVDLAIQCTFFCITHVGFQTLYGAYLRKLTEYANQASYQRCERDVAPIGCVQREAVNVVAGPKPVNYEVRLGAFETLLDDRCLRRDQILEYALLE
ncbi:hypothetical protein CLF_102449, partial [Clonorchis sinensis]